MDVFDNLEDDPNLKGSFQESAEVIQLSRYKPLNIKRTPRTKISDSKEKSSFLDRMKEKCNIRFTFAKGFFGKKKVYPPSAKRKRRISSKDSGFPEDSSQVSIQDYVDTSENDSDLDKESQGTSNASTRATAMKYLDDDTQEDSGGNNLLKMKRKNLKVAKKPRFPTPGKKRKKEPRTDGKLQIKVVTRTPVIRNKMQRKNSFLESLTSSSQVIESYPSPELEKEGRKSPQSAPSEGSQKINKIRKGRKLMTPGSRSSTRLSLVNTKPSAEPSLGILAPKANSSSLEKCSSQDDCMRDSLTSAQINEPQPDCFAEVVQVLNISQCSSNKSSFISISKDWGPDNDDNGMSLQDDSELNSENGSNRVEKGLVDDAVSNGSPLSCDTSVNYSPPSTPMTLKAPPSTPVNSARISENVLENSTTRNPTRHIRYRDRRGSAGFVDWKECIPRIFEDLDHGLSAVETDSDFSEEEDKSKVAADEFENQEHDDLSVVENEESTETKTDTSMEDLEHNSSAELQDDEANSSPALFKRKCSQDGKKISVKDDISDTEMELDAMDVLSSKDSGKITEDHDHNNKVASKEDICDPKSKTEVTKKPRFEERDIFGSTDEEEEGNYDEDENDPVANMFDK